MSVYCAPRRACESGETLSAARCQVTGLPQTVNIPEAASGPNRPLSCRARSNRSATGQGLHLPAWRMQFCIYLSTSKIRNKNSYISWGAAKSCHQYMGGRAFGPPLCRGCAPATPPSKNMPHRPYVFIPALRLNQQGGRQPYPHSDSPRGGNDEGRVKINVKRGVVAASKPLSRSKMPTANGSEDTARFRVQSPK